LKVISLGLSDAILASSSDGHFGVNTGVLPRNEKKVFLIRFPIWNRMDATF